MAKEVAISKRLKISEAQQHIILAVLGASLFLGVAIALVVHLIKQISFNTDVIIAQDQSIVAYSDLIKNIGVCKSPSGSVYSDADLAKCDPNNIDLEDIPGTLRANIVSDLAANSNLTSVPNDNEQSCINPSTGKNFTYKELTDLYNDASDSTALSEASQLVRSCSALRIVPDALPAFKNEEGLLASLNKLFYVSGWEPEALSPSGENMTTELGTNLNVMSVNLQIEANASTTMNVLRNIERSIRQFDVERISIEWSGDNSIDLRGQATAYYMSPSTFNETTKTIEVKE